MPEKRTRKLRNDVTGQRFGRLVVLHPLPERWNNQVVWQCQCDCGKKTAVRAWHLTKGNTRSCGCLTYENDSQLIHGHARPGYETPEYLCWNSMLNRCRNPNVKAFKNYGWRGIKVCEGLNKFEDFLFTWGSRPSPNHSLDRINNDGNYSCGKCHECLANNWPTNCRWATRSEQQSNRRLPRSRFGDRATELENSIRENLHVGDKPLARMLGIGATTVARWRRRIMRRQQPQQLMLPFDANKHS